MNYKSKLEKAILEYQGDVEKCFNTRLGSIEIKKFFTFRPVLAHTLVEVNTDTSEYVQMPSTIYYNSNILMNLLPQAYINYVAIHEMSHLAHKNNINAKTALELDKSHKFEIECIADYATHKILTLKGINPEEIELYAGITLKLIGNAKQAKCLENKLNTFNISMMDYIKNMQAYETV